MNNKNSKQSAASEPQCRGGYTSTKGWITGVIIFIITAGTVFIGMRHRYYAGDNSISVENEKGVAGLIDHRHDNFISEPLHIGMLMIGEDDNGLASKKNQCRHVIPSDFCLADTTHDTILPEDNLHFAPPAEGTAYANVLQKIQQLQPEMKQHDAMYVVGHRYESQLKLDPHHSMSRAHCAGTYFIKEISKHGRTVDLSAAQAERYPSYTGIITALWDSFPSKVLSVITNHVNDVYDIVAADFVGDGGFSTWLQRATIDDAGKMEKQLGGLSIYTLISLHMTTQSADNDPLFGGGSMKYGVMKSWHLNMLESTNQMNHKEEQSGVVHEHLHSVMHDYVMKMDKIVQDDVQGPFAYVLHQITGYPISQLSFLHHRDSASWATGLTLFSTSFLNRKFLDLASKIFDKNPFDFTEWEDLQQEKRDDVLDHFVNILCCEELLESIDAAAPVDEIISKAYKLCKPSDLDSMTELKPLLYDILHGVHNSHVNGHWFDPIKAVPKRTEGNGAYDTDQFNPEDREKARAVLEKEIRKLKKKAYECTDERVVQYTRMVSCTCRPKCNANYILQQTNDHVSPIITGYMSRMLQRHPLS